jgi:adenylate cyclase
VVFSSPLRRTIAFSLSLGLYIAVGWIAYNQFSLMILMVTPILSFVGSGAACMVYQFIHESLEKARTRATLEKYVSQNVVKEMLDSADFEQSLGGQRLPCTILFSDIRGFTTLTESADSHQLVAQLNEYLTEMVECVFRNHGTLDKFIGDAVMAVWGNAASQGARQDAIDAVQTSLEMLEALEKLNAHWRANNVQELEIGIGLNHGEVIVGNMGSPKRQEFTVIGDAVNLASRLEGTTKQYQLPIVIGEEVAALVDDHFILQKVDLIQVKGKTRPVRSFTVLESTAKPLSAEEQAGLAAYHRGIEAYLNSQFEVAIGHFAKSRESFQRNRLAELYIERCKELLAKPPAPGWDGVFILKSK